MAFCSNCGVEVKGEFCSSCGTQSSHSQEMKGTRQSYSQNQNMGTNMRQSGAMSLGTQGSYLMPGDITDINVLNEYKRLSTDGKNSFLLSYNSRKKSVAIGYLLLLLLPGTHYIYLNTKEIGKGIALFILFWLVAIMTLFIGYVIWWFIDLIRMPQMIRNENNKTAMRILLQMGTMTY